MTTEEHAALKHRTLEALGDAIAGSDWAPPDGGILTEAVVVMVWVDTDGGHGWSTLDATVHDWSKLGLLTAALDAARGRVDDDDG